MVAWAVVCRFAGSFNVTCVFTIGHWICTTKTETEDARLAWAEATKGKKKEIEKER